MASSISPKYCLKSVFIEKASNSLSLTCDEVQMLLLFFSPVNATHTILKPCGPLTKTFAALSGVLCLGRQFFCHYRRFIIFKSCLFAEFVCHEEEETE